MGQPNNLIVPQKKENREYNVTFENYLKVSPTCLLLLLTPRQHTKYHSYVILTTFCSGSEMKRFVGLITKASAGKLLKPIS